MKIQITGLGLIGGSYARDLKIAFPQAEICGFDANKDNLEMALQLKIIDRASTPSDVEDASLVIVAVPVNVASEVVKDILNQCGEDTLVIDCGSTKKLICTELGGHKNRKNFLAAHPIAGTEFSGPQAALAGLFQGKTQIICEPEKTDKSLKERALSIFESLGMRIRYMEPEAHDLHISYVSHLSHISSFMLGKTVLEKSKNERDIFDLAGSGFASTVRLAKSSPAMWAPIFEQNKSNVLESLTAYIENLKHFKNLLEKDHFQEVYEEMEKTNHIKSILNGIQ